MNTSCEASRLSRDPRSHHFIMKDQMKLILNQLKEKCSMYTYLYPANADLFPAAGMQCQPVSVSGLS